MSKQISKVPGAHYSTSTRKQGLQNAVSRGKNLITQMQDTLDDIQSNISRESSFKADDQHSDSSQSKKAKQQPHVPSRTQPVLPQSNYEIQAIKAKAFLDEKESLIKLRKSQVKQKKSAAHSDGKTTTEQDISNEKKNNIDTKTQEEIVEIVPVQFIMLQLSQVVFMSNCKFNELPNTVKIYLLVNTESTGEVSQLEVEILKQEVFPLVINKQNNMYIASYNTGTSAAQGNITVGGNDGGILANTESEDSNKSSTYYYGVAINRNVILPYIESDSVTINGRYGSWSIKVHYPLIMKSPYAPLQRNQSKYQIREGDIECLFPQHAKVLTIHGPGGTQKLPIIQDLKVASQQNKPLIMVDLDVRMYSCSSRELSTQFRQIEAEEIEIKQILAKNALLFNDQLEQKKTAVSVQTEETEIDKKDLVKLNTGLYYDDRHQLFYEERELGINNHNMAQNQQQSNYKSRYLHQLGVNEDPSYNQDQETVHTRYSKPVEDQQPVIFLKAIEFDCVPMQIREFKEIVMKFNGQEFKLLEQQPVVSGHLLQNQLLVQIKVMQYQVQPIIIKADQFTAFFSLEQLKIQSQIDKWEPCIDVQGQQCRCRLQISCLPPISLNRNKDYYQFLNKNGQLVQPAISQQTVIPQSDVISTTSKLTASMIAQMYKNGTQKPLEPYQEFKIIDTPIFEKENNNAFNRHHNYASDDNEMLKEINSQQFSTLNNISDITKQLEQHINNLSQQSSFNVSVYHESNHNRQNQTPSSKETNNISIFQDSLNNSQEIESKVEQLVAKSSGWQKAIREHPTTQQDSNLQMSPGKMAMLKASQQLAKSKRRLNGSGKLTTQSIINSVKLERNKKLDNKYELSDSEEEISDVDAKTGKSQPQPIRSSEWLQQQAKKIYEHDSSSSDISD